MLSHAKPEERGVAGPGEQIQGKQVRELLVSVPSDPQRPCPAVPKAPAGSLPELGTAAWDARLVPPTAEAGAGAGAGPGGEGRLCVSFSTKPKAGRSGTADLPGRLRALCTSSHPSLRPPAVWSRMRVPGWHGGSDPCRGARAALSTPQNSLPEIVPSAGTAIPSITICSPRSFPIPPAARHRRPRPLGRRCRACASPGEPSRLGSGWGCSVGLAAAGKTCRSFCEVCTGTGTGTRPTPWRQTWDAHGERRCCGLSCCSGRRRTAGGETPRRG